MPNEWLPGAFVDPGANADYQSGRNRLEIAVAHYTVGADSRSIGRRGYFHWLIHRDASRENGCTQYAPTTAQTWHAGGSSSMPDANARGVGIEYERRVTGPPGLDGLSEAEPLTQNQIDWGARIVAHCSDWGIPVDLYPGPRYGAGSWRGWVNHHDLDRDRSDGLSRAEWNLLTVPPVDSLPTLPKGVDMFVLNCAGQAPVAVVPDLPECYEIADPGTAPVIGVSPEQRAYIINSVRGFGTTIKGTALRAAIDAHHDDPE